MYDIVELNLRSCSNKGFEVTRFLFVGLMPWRIHYPCPYNSAPTAARDDTASLASTCSVWLRAV